MSAASIASGRIPSKLTMRTRLTPKLIGVAVGMGAKVGSMVGSTVAAKIGVTVGVMIHSGAGVEITGVVVGAAAKALTV